MIEAGTVSVSAGRPAKASTTMGDAGDSCVFHCARHSLVFSDEHNVGRMSHVRQGASGVVNRGR